MLWSSPHFPEVRTMTCWSSSWPSSSRSLAGTHHHKAPGCLICWTARSTMPQRDSSWQLRLNTRRYQQQPSYTGCDISGWLSAAYQCTSQTVRCTEFTLRGDNAEGHTCRPLTPSGAAVCDVGTKVLCADNSVIDSDVRPWYVCQERPANF